MSKILFFLILTISIIDCSITNKADSTALTTNEAIASNVKAEPGNLPFSPFEIGALVQESDSLDLTRLWERLGFEDDTFKVVGKDNFKVVSASIDGDDSADAVLAVWNSLNQETRFVLFRQNTDFKTPQEQWKFYGYVDISDQKYSMPEFFVVNAPLKNCLVVRQLTGSGTGVASYRDVFYEIRPGELKAVLDYPSKGHDMNNNPWDRDYASELAWYSGNEIEVEFGVNWNGDISDDKPENAAFFSEMEKAFFVWDESAHKFVFDEKRSVITERKLKDVYNFDTIDESSFLKYTFKNLLSMAQNGSRKQKLRLENALSKLPDGKQKHRLKIVLENKK